MAVNEWHTFGRYLTGVMLSLVDLYFVGIPITLAGLIAAGLVIKNQIGRTVTLYENGLVVKDKGRQSRWPIGDITDFRINTIHNPYTGRERLSAYVFYAGDQRILTIGSSFAEWQRYGHQFGQAVIHHRTQTLLERFNQGETITFNRLQRLTLFPSARATLTVSRQGLQVNNDPLIEWAQIESVLKPPDRSVLEIVTTGNKRYVFHYHNSRSTIIARHLLRFVRPH